MCSTEWECTFVSLSGESSGPNHLFKVANINQEKKRVWYKNLRFYMNWNIHQQWLVFSTRLKINTLRLKIQDNILPEVPRWYTLVIKIEWRTVSMLLRNQIRLGQMCLRHQHYTSFHHKSKSNWSFTLFPDLKPNRGSDEIYLFSKKRFSCSTIISSSILQHTDLRFIGR